MKLARAPVGTARAPRDAVALDRYGRVLGRYAFDRLVRGMHPTVFILRRE